MFPIEKYWVHFLCVWVFSHTLYCKATVATNGNLSQDVEAGLDFQPIKLPCFQQSVLSVLDCSVSCSYLTVVLFSRLWGEFSFNISIIPHSALHSRYVQESLRCLSFLCCFFLFLSAPQWWLLFPRMIKGWWFSRMEYGDDSHLVATWVWTCALFWGSWRTFL